MSINKCIYMLTVFFGLIFSPNTQAQNLWGSGYYQGQMICPYESKTSSSAIDTSDEVKVERERIAELKSEMKLKRNEKKRNEAKVDLLKKKIERYFDSTVSSFLLETHIEGAKKCDEYKTAHAKCNGASIAEGDKTFCDGLDNTVPELLLKKWTDKDSTGRGGYCIGNSKSNAGSVNSSICSDTSLRPTDTIKSRSVNTTECSRNLSEYRKKRIELANAADKEDKLTQEIEDRQLAITDIRERARLEREYDRKFTESDCEDCNPDDGYSYRKPKRDWISTAVNVAGGLGMLYFGKKAEQAANEYNAQAGWPSSQSYGYP
ncbi:MAG: hypothetical protein ABL927_14355, partial [Bdellovibrionales bacterium]